MPLEKKHILITGANGNLGRRLIPVLLADYRVTAVVRSKRARLTLTQWLDNKDFRIETVDYADLAGMTAVTRGVDSIVHLVGIIKEGATSSYVGAHENSCKVLIQAAELNDVKKIVYLSILGSSSSSDNPCLASKGRAEELLLSSAVNCSVLQVPMVLGEGDFASVALRTRASKRISFGFRNASLEQPIYAGDVIAAIMATLTKSELTGSLQLAGPESVTRRDLTRRAASQLGGQSVSISLPFAVGLGLAGLLEVISSSPPVTRAMLDVLDHDDNIDADAGAAQLGITLTDLDKTLSLVMTP